jgi:hypothetical protein
LIHLHQTGESFPVGYFSAMSLTYWVARDPTEVGAFRIIEKTPSNRSRRFVFPDRAAAENFLISLGATELDAWQIFDVAASEGATCFSPDAD